MTGVPLTHILNDVRVVGATKRKIIRAKDATIRTLKAGYIYVDADDRTFDVLAKSGRSLFGGYRWNWNGTDIVRAESDAGFNNQPAFQGTGNLHHFSIPDPPSLASYTIIGCYSMPQSVIDAALAFTLGVRSPWSVYDAVANRFVSGPRFFGAGAHYGWTFTSDGSVENNSMGIFDSPDATPTADQAFLFAITFDLPTLVCKMYFNDGETPVASATMLAGDAGGADGRYYPMSFSIGSNTASWEGDMACWLVHDDSNPSFAMTDAQRIGIMADWRAAYDIVL